MPIAAIRTHRFSAPLHTPFVTSLRRATSVDSLLVEVIDSDGRSGFGEAPQVWAVTGANMAGSQAAVEEMIGPRLIGRDPDDLNANCAIVAKAVVGNEAAKAAVDVALHDLAARRLGIPLPRLLGAPAITAATSSAAANSAADGDGAGAGPGRGVVVATDVTLAAGAAEALGAAAKERVAEGFRVLKVKVGTDAEGDLARIRAVCDAVGGAAKVRLDANQGWTPREAIRIINGISEEGLPVEFVEQPVAAKDLDGLAHVSQRVDIPIMADESVFGLRDLVEVIRRRAADLVNVKLAKCGGLGVARTLLVLAESHGLGTCVGSMMEGPVGLGAAASLVAAYPTSVVSDLDAAWWLSESPLQGGLRYINGTVVLPDTPGLGIDL
ncbi:dipeptide epimerase [Rhizocola hellebori]|uniref:Dipeptide epimerase n=1 Tax=Rhizocola hellebori TaxID=1392758 RepID=A0A8J3VGM8_9ACTN|nr:dipeptide epimerase [Rhizocola hellebori]GIH05053.1 dipeptide epimerase [Rhizocola hellebori]